MQLVATKYQIPPLPGEIVARPSLLGWLDRAILAGARLLLLSAPAGYGKTTLLQQWGAAQRMGMAWLTVDSSDNAPQHFWAYLLAALRQGVSLPCTGAGRMLLSTPTASSDLLALLANEIAAAREPIALVLDNYQTIEAEPIHAAVTSLLQYAPPNLHLVIATRSPLPLPLAQLRGRNQLWELGPHDLACDDATATALLTAQVPELPPTLSAQINAGLEGWVAGLRMTAFALANHNDPATWPQTVLNSQHKLQEYLATEVLERQPADIQQFLTRTAVAEHLCAPLCAALLEGSTAQSKAALLLEQLATQNLFVAALDPERRWYRCHTLLRGLLLQRLAAAEPQTVPLLHQRASQWYHGAGLWKEAIEQALLANNQARAVDLVRALAETLVGQGAADALCRWVARLPDDLLAGSSPPPVPAYAGRRPPPPDSTMLAPILEPLPEALSRRELQVLQLVEAGLSNGDIARQLTVAPCTVKTHIHSIFRKLQVTRRAQAIARARQPH
ncbi:MAG: hypothetical protein KGS73_15170 [Chloroflexi bacterium]|nr:hypothetical protein [Chloroflexota bacterium]